MSGRRKWLIRLGAGFALLALIAAVCAVLVWWKFFRPGEQEFADETARFEYGSLNGELIAGLPYPLFMTLPRVFPDLVEKYATEGYGADKRGTGGYGAFGLAWAEGERLPAGLSIRRRGPERVTMNCALCHTASYRLAPDGKTRFAVGGPAHTLNLAGLLRFLVAASHDPRFSAARLLPEMNVQFPMDALDQADYAAVLIPGTRAALQLAGNELGWMDEKPAWGPGRDDAFNLPKYILTQSPWDDTIGTTKFPALWGLGGEARLYHAAGEAETLYAVIATSAIGIGSPPAEGFRARNEWIEAFIHGLKPPPWPGEIDAGLAARGKAVFASECATCHAPGGARTGSVIPLAEIGTDPEHVRTFTEKDAARMNLVVRALGADGAAVQGAQGGYVAKPLVGVWLLGPYLHNGSVPTLRDLLTPPAARPKVFFAGTDLVDFDKVGFVSSGPFAAAQGFRFDTGLRGNGNGGHDYGTGLDAADKRALIEYLKEL